MRLSQLSRSWITFLCLLFAAAVADAEPTLRIRVLAREHPVKASVFTTASVRCDGELVSGTQTYWLEAKPASQRNRTVVAVRDTDAGVTMHFDPRDPGGPFIRLGSAPGRECDSIVIDPGEHTVTVGAVQQQYLGRLELRAADGELIVEELAELEPYVAAVVNDEGASLPPEARKAQAVVSRTWALANRGRHKEAGYDLCDLTHCQLYRGTAKVPPSVRESVQSTAGMTLRTKDHALISTPFHAACGGATSSARDVFLEDGVSGVADTAPDGKPLCAGAEDFNWSYELTAEQLRSALGVSGEGETRVLRKDRAGAVVQLAVFGRKLSGRDFVASVTRAYGFQTLCSNRFSIERVKDRVLIKGRGVGHGVGLCQAGAAELAREGEGFREILKHYFPNALLEGDRSR